MLSNFSLVSAAEHYRYLSDRLWFLRGHCSLIKGLCNATDSDDSMRAPLHSQTGDLTIPKHNVYLKASELKAAGS